ncbi:SGNH/GDSL hydrolase family protein [Amycolatopsis anabasis]|uniref:SGNH/GDSL hydrolase family protein n=1 Tax=Amycolatopsis anabasis TaxID=1840409 RepID=UPI00131EBEC7|nr:SGNH/GDSL hydrolase family protein [Amycolatopsis anabasis]
MRSRRSLLTVAVIVFTMAASSLTAAAATATPAYTRYVALGDSYTSGPFIPWPKLFPLGCGKSTNNYPSLLARQLKVKSFTDISCGGADTSHMTEPQSVFLGTNPPQFSALRADTDLVTLGIGGNDYGVFASLVDTCSRLRESDPTGAPCQAHFTVNGVDTVKAKVPDIQRNITGVLRGIHARSPQAEVLAIGYPRIGPPSGTCPDILPFADGDYAWMNSVEEALNGAVAGAAETDGSASFVDMYPASLGHDACAPDGAAWIQGKDTDLFAAAAYHPRRAGMAGVASVTYRHLTAG